MHANDLLVSASFPLRHLHARLPYGSLPRRTLASILTRGRISGILPSTEVLDIPGQHGYRLVNCNSQVVRAVWWLGEYGYEGIFSKVWRELCDQASGVLEIGANIGWYSILGSKAAPRVPYLAIEPEPTAHALLVRNLALNEAPAQPLGVAVIPGDRSQTVEFVVPTEDHYSISTGGQVMGSSNELSRQGRIVRVEGRSIRTLIAEQSSISLIKIDAEGIEYDLLRDVEGWIGEQRPTLAVELLPAASSLDTYLRSLILKYRYRAYAVPKRRYRDLVDITEANVLREGAARAFSRDIIMRPI